MNGRPSFLRSAYVVARRDYLTMLLSKGFLFLLLVPIFSLTITGIAGAILISGGSRATTSHIVFDMDKPSLNSIEESYKRIDGRLMKTKMVIRDHKEKLDPQEVLEDAELKVSALVQGTLADPVVYLGRDGAQHMPQVRLMLAEARNGHDSAWKEPKTVTVGKPSRGTVMMGGAEQFFSSKILQFVLYIVTSTMASMVLASLTEEKSNRLVEILSTAMPIQSLFAGKLVAMLAITLTAFGIWGAGIGLLVTGTGIDLGGVMPSEPPLGWHAAILLFGCYFVASYLLVGSLYLALGGLAATPRDAQIYALPIAMLQIVSFLVGSWASTQGGAAAWVSASIPMVSPYVLVGMAVEGRGIAIHLAGIAWQFLVVAVVVQASSTVFRRNIVGRGTGSRNRRRAASVEEIRNESVSQAS